MGFQKIINLVELGKQNLSYKHSKSTYLHIKVRVTITRNGQNMDLYIAKDPPQYNNSQLV